MDITIFGFKINVEMLILIGVVYLILVVHTIGGCCNMPRIVEKLSNMNSSNSSDSSDNIKKMAMLKKNNNNKFI